MPHVGELILLAAPSCCGKTRFLEQLHASPASNLAQLLHLSAPVDSYVSIIPAEIGAYRGADVERMILHFAIPTIAINDGTLGALADEPRLQVVKNSDSVTAITLVAGPKVLSHRLALRYRENRKMIYRKFHRYLSERRRMNRLRDMYAGPAPVVRAYETWFEYVHSLPNLKVSRLVTAESGYEGFSPDDWGCLKQNWFNPPNPLRNAQ